MAVIEEQSDGEEQQSVVNGVTESIASLGIVATGGEDDDGEPGGEEEEDEVWQGGFKGFVQKPNEEPWKVFRQYFPSKAGGVPAWLDPMNIPRGDSMLCGICDKPLQFVLQVYSPDEDDDAGFHRTLFVFICTSLACLQQDELQQHKEGKRHRSVKVFRSQLPRRNPFYSWNPPSADGSELSLVEGSPLCTWCRTWRGTKLCGGCKRTRYCSQTHQLDHWKADHAAYCRRVQELLKSSSPSATTVSEDPVIPIPSALSYSLWPEFELIVDDTRDSEEGSDDNNAEGDVNPRARAGRLLEDYERRRTQGSDFSLKDVQDVEESSLEEQHWAFFQVKVSESPDQVLWYHRSADAKPLWPKLTGQPKPSDIPACSLCGEARTFEFQILPQLLYFFDVKDHPDSLDWGTIAVYSCASSCHIQGYDLLLSPDDKKLMATRVKFFYGMDLGF